MTPPPKPRRYNGPVDFLIRARAIAETWDGGTMERVLALFPYPPSRGVREQDWVLLVAHTTTRHGETPVAAAERLALYVKARAEQTGQHPTPDTLKETHDG